MTKRDVMCLSKRRHDSKKAADAAILKTRSLVPLCSYRCTFCGHFHLTSAPFRLEFKGRSYQGVNSEQK